MRQLGKRSPSRISAQWIWLVESFVRGRTSGNSRKILLASGIAENVVSRIDGMVRQRKILASPRRELARRAGAAANPANEPLCL
jgi:hypothetical protein